MSSLNSISNNTNSNNNNKNLSISSLISSSIEDPMAKDSEKNLESKFYDAASNTITASPIVNGRKTDVIVIDDDDEVVLVGEVKHNKHDFLKQLLQPPPTTTTTTTSSLTVTVPPQILPSLPMPKKSTKVSLMSMMNADNNPTTPTPTIKPLEKSTAASIKKDEAKPKLARKPRAKKTLAPSNDLNTTIIIDGKPVLIPSIAPTQRTSDGQPPKKRAKKDTTTTNGEKKSAKPAAKKASKPKLLSLLLLLLLTTPKSQDSAVVTPLPQINPLSISSVTPSKSTASTPSTSTANTLNLPAKTIKRGPRPKSDAVTLMPTMPHVKPVENESTPIKTLDPPKLADVKMSSPVVEISSPSNAHKLTLTQKPEIDRLDPLAGKKLTDSVVEEPIISLHIPLTAPNQPPGSAQVIFNVTKLSEDKYGWKAIHPGAKFAIDELNEDDDMEDMEDDDEELDEADKLKREREREAEKEKERKEKEEEKPKKKELSFEAKMNRKIGKYDYEDPFIDDAELLWDEQHVSTKDGFFVYYGPLFEEGQNPRIEKLDNKGRGGGGSGSGGSGGGSGGGASRNSTQRSSNGQALSVNGKPIGNPHRGNNGRFSSNNNNGGGGGLVTTGTKSPSVENSGSAAPSEIHKPLIAIQPKSRAGTPPVKVDTLI